MRFNHPLQLEIMKLSILIPCYNEERTILEIIKRVKEVPLPELEKEIIIVDDGSTDGTRELLKSLPPSPELSIIFHTKNKGKGSAIQTALSRATGDICIIQDADLEYNPSEYPKLLSPILHGQAPVVYGSRYHAARSDPAQRFRLFRYGVLFLTRFINYLYGSTLTDEATDYKVFKHDILTSLVLRENGFGFCPEVTCKLLKKGIEITEVPVRFTSPRSFKDGKKIRWTDGLVAFWIILKYRIIS